MIDFLIISNLKAYLHQDLDVPNFYRRAADNHNFNLFHLDSEQVLGKQTQAKNIWATKVNADLTYQKFLELENQQKNIYSLKKFDLVFCRTLKPFPQGYLDRLSYWENFTKFVNSPSRKKEQITADFLLKVAEKWIPDTVVTNDWQKAFAFWEKHQIIVAKQINSCGGRGVFKIWYEGGLFQVDHFQAGVHSFAHFARAIDYARGTTQAPLQLVRYLPGVKQGDKRVIVVDGEIYGAYIRRSKTDHWVNNVSGDGECLPAEISEFERKAIADTVGAYQQRGLHTLGYDFLQDSDGLWRISEINAGNIGGFYRLEQLTQTPAIDRLLDWLIDFSKSNAVSTDF